MKWTLISTMSQYLAVGGYVLGRKECLYVFQVGYSLGWLFNKTPLILGGPSTRHPWSWVPYNKTLILGGPSTRHPGLGWPFNTTPLILGGLERHKTFYQQKQSPCQLLCRLLKPWRSLFPIFVNPQCKCGEPFIIEKSKTLNRWVKVILAIYVAWKME